MDDLGRIVIPKEIRRIHRIKEGDPIEMFVNADGDLVVKKHSPVRDIERVAGQYAETLAAATGHTVLVCDNDSVMAAGGPGKKEYIGKSVSAELYKAFLARKNLVLNKTSDALLPVTKDGGGDAGSQAVAPVLAGGDVFGGVVLLSGKNTAFGPGEQSLCAVAAAFLGTQLS
jgi:AbrB family transcriptional regulator (stage V sporulation protein T)